MSTHRIIKCDICNREMNPDIYDPEDIEMGFYFPRVRGERVERRFINDLCFPCSERIHRAIEKEFSILL